MTSHMFYAFLMKTRLGGSTLQAPVVQRLPVVTRAAPVAAILAQSMGSTQAGLYLQMSSRWHMVLPQEALNNALWAPKTTEVYRGVTAPVSVPSGSLLYQNGGLSSLTSIPVDDSSFWAIVTPASAASPGPEPTNVPVVYQNFVPQVRGSGYAGVLTQWIVTQDFTINSFDNCRIVLDSEVPKEEFEVPFTLRVDGQPFANLVYRGETQSFDITTFTPTTLPSGARLSFYQDDSIITMPALTILISN